LVTYFDAHGTRILKAGLAQAAVEACGAHENAKAELKSLMPDDAKEAIGHGVRAKRGYHLTGRYARSAIFRRLIGWELR
jgi:hypothetical protein